MAKITMSDDKGAYEQGLLKWREITHSLEPETKTLPLKDRRYYESKIKLLIGKEIRLSNLPPRHIYTYIKRLDLIVKTMRYPMLVDEEFIRSEITKLLFRLGIRLSEEGLGWKYGPMGFQQQKITQEVIGVPTTTNLGGR
jgi:hypothetical protein